MRSKKFCKKLDPVVFRQRTERLSGAPVAGARRRAQDQIEILFPVVHEVAHFVIDPEIHATVPNMALQQRAGPQQVEDDAPTGHLRMMIAAGVVLPEVSETVLARRLRQRADEDFRAVHSQS